MSVQAFSTVIPFTPPIASLSLSLSLSLSVSLDLPPLSLLDSCSRMLPYKATALSSQRMTQGTTDWMRHKLSINSTVAETVRQIPWRFMSACAGPPLTQRWPSFSASLSSHLSIFPSFLLRLSLLCVIAGHVTPSHLRTVVASPSYIVIQTKSVQFDFVNWKSHAAFFHVIFYCLFLITTSLCYSGGIQKEIIYREHWHPLSLFISQHLYAGVPNADCEHINGKVVVCIKDNWQNGACFALCNACFIPVQSTKSHH